MSRKANGEAGPISSKRYPPIIVNDRSPKDAQNQNKPNIVPRISAGIPLKNNASMLMFSMLEEQTYRTQRAIDHGLLGSLSWMKKKPAKHLKPNANGMKKRKGILSASYPRIGRSNAESMNEMIIIFWYNALDSCSDSIKPESTKLVIQRSM